MDLIKSTSITKLLALKAEMLENYDKFYKLGNLGTFINILSSDRISTYHFIEKEKEFLLNLNKYLWGKFIMKCPFFEVMPKKLQREWRDKVSLSDGSFVPDFTFLNIKETFLKYYLEMDKFTIEKIETLFQHLHPKYKTNNKMKFTKKMILKEYQRDSLRELEDVFCRIESKPLLPRDNNRAEYYFSPFHSNEVRISESHYFLLKEFKNKNIHVIIKDEELIVGINKILAKSTPNTIGY